MRSAVAKLRASAFASAFAAAAAGAVAAVSCRLIDVGLSAGSGCEIG
jgi:hypothetical protein